MHQLDTYITPFKISLFAYCPERARITEDVLGDNRNRAIRTIIQKSWMYYLRKSQRKPPWKRILKWVEEELARLSKDRNFKEDQPLLTRLHSWYYDELVSFTGIRYPAVPITFPVRTRLTYRDVMDIAIIDDSIVLYDFREAGVPNILPESPYLLNTDLSVLARIWGFNKTTQMLPTRYIRRIIRPRSILSVKLDINESIEDKFPIIESLVDSMNYRMAYPVIGQQCQTCPIEDRCCKEDFKLCH